MARVDLPEEYLQDILVRLAHHSSAIEGNTISLPDTVSIILHNTIPGKTSRREYFEIENHRETFHYMLENVINGTALSLSIIKGIHERLTDRLLVDKEQFKQSENAIMGADFKTASPQETPHLMKQWVDNLNYQLEHATERDDIVRIVIDFHIQFERIHPFSDGNGRTGRMLINYSLLERDLPPLIIRAKDKPDYIHYLGTANIEQFTEFALERMKEEAERLKCFMNVEEKILKDWDE